MTSRQLATDPPRARAVARPHLAKGSPVAIFHDHRARGGRRSKLLGQRGRGHDRAEDAGERQRRGRSPPPPLQERGDRATRRPLHERGDDASHPLLHDGVLGRQGFGAAGPTVNRVAPVRPQTSGEYMHSARVGGTTKSPGVVARARVRKW